MSRLHGLCAKERTDIIDVYNQFTTSTTESSGLKTMAWTKTLATIPGWTTESNGPREHVDVEGVEGADAVFYPWSPGVEEYALSHGQS